MKAKSVLCAVAVLAVSTLATPATFLAQQAAPQAAVKTLAATEAAKSQAVTTIFGRITKSSGSYVLIESASKAQYTLDDQKTAKRYNGRAVFITGTLNLESKSIHVQNIEAAA